MFLGVSVHTEHRLPWISGTGAQHHSTGCFPSSQLWPIAIALLQLCHACLLARACVFHLSIQNRWSWQVKHTCMCSFSICCKQRLWELTECSCLQCSLWVGNEDLLKFQGESQVLPHLRAILLRFSQNPPLVDPELSYMGSHGTSEILLIIYWSLQVWDHWAI